MAGEVRSTTTDLEAAELKRALWDAREQLTATKDVLSALGRSSSDADAVLDTLVASALRLCRGDVAQIHLIHGDVYQLAASSGRPPPQGYQEHISRYPFKLDRGSLIGRVGLDAHAQQIPDVLADPGYMRHDVQRLSGFRSIVGAPMLFDGDVLGVLTVWRSEVDPFDSRAIDLLTNFATQAAIGIRTVGLVRDLHARGVELGGKVDQLEALGAIGAAVNSSLDLDEVLSMIVMHAVQMSGTDGGSIMEFDEAVQEFHVRAAYGTSQQLLDDLRNARIGLGSTLVGRAATEGRPLVVPDLEGQLLDAHTERLYSAGWRSILAVPILRDGRIVGVLVVRRKTAGGYSADIMDVLETFAGQSAVAILNARLYRELELKSAELEVASRHKSEFLASMSHELRTPLNAVIGFSEVLLERMFGDLNERQEEYLHDILSSGQHLLDLLNDILDLSKVEAGRMELDRSFFPVQQAIDYGIAMVRERAAQHDIDIACDIAPDVGDVHADELRFRQVLLNLLTNAVKFTPDGGTVTIGARTDGAEVTLAVTDTGIGIAPEDRARIFESFQQGTRAARRQEGTGLGLTLSRRIVDLHSGRMWLDSEVGVGSTFGFAVPAAPATFPVRTSVGRSTGRPAILVVEDDPHSLDLLMLYLDGLDMDIVGTTTGEEGLAVIRELLPRAVILDLRLPGMDGWELLRTIRGDPGLADVPVIVVSVVDDRPRGLALGAAVYLVKPVTRDEILTALETVHATPLAQTASSAKPRPDVS